MKLRLYKDGETILTARFRENGTGSLPKKWKGTAESFMIRNACQYMATHPEEIRYTFEGSWIVARLEEKP